MKKPFSILYYIFSHMAPNITFNRRGILGFYGNSIHLIIVNFINNFQQIGAQYEL